LIEPIPGDNQHSLVTFLWWANEGTRNVAIVGGLMNGAEPAKNQMVRINGSNIWYLSFAIRNDARFTYSFAPNDSLLPLLDPNRKLRDFRRDPLNRRDFPDTGSSYVELPDAPVEPWRTPTPQSARGRLEETTFASSLLKNERVMWVYTPAGFDATDARFPLLVLLDGGAYTLPDAPAAPILDHLITTRRIPPMVAVLVGNTRRLVELPSPEFADFLAMEIVPWAQQRHRASRNATDIVVAGSSIGGFGASLAGLQHPEVFGNVLSMSGSYWWDRGGDGEREWLTRRYETTPRRSLRFFVAVGTMEVAENQLATNRRFRDVLIAKRYPVTYQEFNSGHGYIGWRRALFDGLIALLGEK
jgi:enterochelin esterase family protein